MRGYYYEPSAAAMDLRETIQKTVVTDEADIDRVLSELEEQADELVQTCIHFEDTAYEDQEKSIDPEQAETLTTRIELVVRDLQWNDPDSTTLRDLTDALRGFDKGEVVTFA